MQNLATGLALWFAASLLFGLFWVLSGLALKEARRRWPHMASDSAWRSARHRELPSHRRSHGAD